MARVTFVFDKEKDLENIWKACNSEKNYGYDFKKSIPKNIIDMCMGKEYNIVKKELGKKLEMTHKSELIKQVIKAVNLSWRGIEKEYFKRMDKIMKHKFPNIKITGYLTTISKCPYSYNKKDPHFMFNMFSSIPGILQISGHELMHFYVHYFHWDKIEKQIGYEKTKDLKQALTVLLNEEFRDLWLARDVGYDNHEKLRKFIQEEWKKKKDIDVLLKKCIENKEIWAS